MTSEEGPDKISSAGGTPMSREEIDEILGKQEKRRLSAFQASKLEKEAKKNWDIFYKRNETRFFKDRHWTLREFQEILDWPPGEGPTLLEVGCGCGNFAIPLLQEIPKLKVFACDFSPRAVDFVKSHEKYDEGRIKAFVCDITEPDCFRVLQSPEFTFSTAVSDTAATTTSIKSYEEDRKLFGSVDFVSMIFVLSAISPTKHSETVENIAKAMKPGGIVFFRDYGRYDMAQLRFKGGNKIDENFYARRDGTRAYYFTPEEVELVFTNKGQFRKLECDYVYRRTVNIKEDVDVGRTFVQAKFIKI